MDRIRNWAVYVYDKVVEEDHLEPLTQTEVYYILQKPQRRKNSIQISDGRKMSIDELGEEIINKLEMIQAVSPERQFRVVGRDPAFQLLEKRIRELRRELSWVENLMTEMFPQYKETIEDSINQLNYLQPERQITSKKVASLKQKLFLLEKRNKYAKKIALLNLKANNLKKTLKLLNKIPNIKKMSLVELKSIDLQQLKQKQSLGELTCLYQVEDYIDLIVAKELQGVIKRLEISLIGKFDANNYEDALKNYLVAQQYKINYQKLLIKIVQKQIHRVNSELSTNIYAVCQFYITLLINLHNLFRWHREHEQKEEWQAQLLKEKKNMHIKIDTKNVRQKIVQIMDQCMKDLAIEKFYRCEVQVMLEVLYYVGRMSAIGFTFSGNRFTQTIEQLSDFVRKRMEKILEKGFGELKETLALQEMNEWSRLPVANDYSHDPLDRTLYQIKKHCQSEFYSQIDISQIKSLNAPNSNSSEDWQILNLTLPSVTKFEKNREQVRLSIESEVVICQSSLCVLKFMESITKYIFYFPLEKSAQKGVGMLFYLLQYYTYYIFCTFGSAPLKGIFFEEMETIQQKYSKKRASFIYPHLFTFVNKFKNNSKQQIRQQSQKRDRQNFIRMRVVAMQSASFIHAYVTHILSITDMASEQTSSKLNIHLEILQELSELIFMDSIPKICKLENTQSIIRKIKWTEDYSNIREYIRLLESNFGEFYYKMKAVNKGEVPFIILERIFGIYWKTQLHIIIKVFLNEYSSSKNFTISPKATFQKFIDDLFTLTQKFLPSPNFIMTPYQKIKSIFPILLESSWQKCWQLLQQSLKNFEFIYKVEMGILMVSQANCSLSVSQMEQHKKVMEKWVSEALLS